MCRLHIQQICLIRTVFVQFRKSIGVTKYKQNYIQNVLSYWQECIFSVYD